MMVAVLVFYADDTLTDLGTYKGFTTAYNATCSVINHFIQTRQVVKIEYVIGNK